MVDGEYKSYTMTENHSKNTWVMPDGASHAAPPEYDSHPTLIGDSDEPTGGVMPPSIPGFELGPEVARGGMGVIFQARDLSINRIVAIKLLQERFPSNSPAGRRFIEEAQITGQLQHPGIPPIYQVGQLGDGRPYLVMKLIKGETLEAQIHRGAKTNYLALIEAIAQAVGYAHAHGVIHRDLKPANIMVGPFGEVQVMDWGLAKFVVPAAGREPERPWATELTQELKDPRAGSDTSVTQVGSILGTPAYMAPEQAAGEFDKIDQRADVFGLGAVLCSLLTGQPPYSGATADNVYLQAVWGQIDETLARLDACGAEPEVIALCRRCLAFDPKDRPADGNAVASAVAELRRQAEARAKQAEIEEAKARVFVAEQRKRRRIGFVLAAVLLVAGIASSLLALRADAARAGEAAARAAETEARARAIAERDEKDKALEAEAHARLTAQLKQAEAEKNLEYARRSNEMLLAVFRSLDPKFTYTTVAELRSILKVQLFQAVREIEKAGFADPMLVAKLQETAGHTLYGFGEPESAVALLEKSLATTRASLGATHPDTLNILNRLAWAYRNAGMFKKGAYARRELAEHYEKTFGQDDRRTLVILAALAFEYRLAHELLTSSQLYDQLLPRFDDVFGADHFETLHLLHNHALTLQESRRPNEAIASSEQLLTRLERSGFEVQESPYFVHHAFAILEGSGLHANAEPWRRKWLATVKQREGPDAEATLRETHGLAVNLMQQQKWAQAEPLLLEWYAALTRQAAKPDVQPHAPHLAEACDRLIAIYTALEKPDQVAKWQAERNKWP
jgi:hypothetical protein